MAYTDEQIRAWISRTLPREAAATLDSTPMETLYALYPEICKYGPNGSNFVEAQKDMAEAMEVAPTPGRAMHELTSDVMQVHVENPAAVALRSSCLMEAVDALATK